MSKKNECKTTKVVQNDKAEVKNVEWSIDPESIDPESPVAIYKQIENQIMSAVTSGRLVEGDAISSLRIMANMPNLNNGTMQKVYRDLTVLGVLVTRRGKGHTVAPGAKKLCEEAIIGYFRRAASIF